MEPRSSTGQVTELPVILSAPLPLAPTVLRRRKTRWRKTRWAKLWRLKLRRLKLQAPKLRESQRLMLVAVKVARKGQRQLLTKVEMVR